MILRRVIAHFQKQEWTAIAIDFLIVVFGVFVGLQVSNWNADRVERGQERAFIASVREAIRQDADDMQGYIDLLDIDLKHGARALATFDAAGPCGKDCWPRIIDYFFASQWIDVTTDPIVYGEIQRTGLPRDANLKSVITRYYGLQNQIASILVVLPAYRERVRSIIPAAAQAHIWRVCFRAEGRRQFFDETCPSPVNDDEARAIFDALHNDVELRGMLNYWLSTVSLVRITLGQQIVEANKTVAAIDDHLGTHP